MDKLLDFGFQHIDLWRSEPMELVQVRGLMVDWRA